MTDLRKSVKETINLGKAINNLCIGIKEMKATGMTERAIVVLAADAAGVSKPSAERVIKALDKMRDLYLIEEKL